jgi:hypothetical protein
MEFNGTKVPIDAAAAALNVTQDFIRIGMQKGVLPIGSCFKMDGSTRTVYYISPKLLYDYSGYAYEPAIKKDHSCESGQSKMNN